jgi:hypothetical protein
MEISETMGEDQVSSKDMEYRNEKDCTDFIHIEPES